MLQHRDSQELRGVASTGTELHSLYRELPPSARLVKRSSCINGETGAKPGRLAPPRTLPVASLMPFLSPFSEVGRSGKVQRKHDQAVLIPASHQQTTFHTKGGDGDAPARPPTKAFSRCSCATVTRSLDLIYAFYTLTSI